MTFVEKFMILWRRAGESYSCTGIEKKKNFSHLSIVPQKAALLAQLIRPRC